MPDRTYRVLALSDQNEAISESLEVGVLLDLGVHPGHDAKAATEAALAATGLPDGVKVCAAVPVNNWSEADVAPDPRPQFKVTPRKGAAATS